ncbi:hypothetical protein SAMN05216511_7029 [Streptomyces sp. KS_16]|nr:hypothetical protein SAMN05216511_7029 [Streptomyces sp. KS_16]
MAVEVGPAGAVGEVDGGGEAEGAGGEAAEHQRGAAAGDQVGDAQRRGDTTAFGELDVEAVHPAGQPPGVLDTDRVLVGDDRQRRAFGQPGQRLRVAGGERLLHRFDAEVRVAGQQGLGQGRGPAAVGVEQQPRVRRGTAYGPYPVEVVLGIRETGLDLEDGEALPGQPARLLRGRPRRGDADRAGGGGPRRPRAPEQPVHGDAGALADEVEQCGLHGRRHRRGRAGYGQFAGAQGGECALGVGPAGEFSCGPVQQPGEGGGVQSVVGAGHGLAVAVVAVVFDGEPHGVAGRHGGAGYP